MQRSKLGSTAITSLLICSPALFAQEFEQCPTEAFLVQGPSAVLYGVDLSTGQYEVLSDAMGTDGKLNAIAFNYHDSYVYAWSYEFNTVVRIDNQFQVEPISITGLPNTSFYVGDISLDENAYYLFRSGGVGLQRIALDPQDPDYLVAQQVPNSGTINLAIFDLAFHPSNGTAYSVDRSGRLVAIDVYAGSYEVIRNVGQSGTFGAVYFDLSGNLYISRNSDGQIFRVDINEGDAELFAHGPNSSNNDGARCALAPVIPVDAPNADFGDAPDSYKTKMEDNGPRHGVEGSQLYLGTTIDAEFDAYTFPLSDESHASEDEDGVHMITSIEVNNMSLVQIQAHGLGYLNAWIDFDQNGKFDQDEQIFEDHLLIDGINNAAFNTPSWAEAGETWARFRFSSTTGIGPSGGVSDGEVEDYQLVITEPGVELSYYPNEGSWATIAFEDNWPLMGDYDFTDLVINYRLTEFRRNNEVIKVKIEGQIAALGAAFHNGFAFHLRDVPSQLVDEDSIRFKVNDQLQSESPLESGRDATILQVFSDAWNHVSAAEGCKYHRTESGCGSEIQMRFSMTVPFSEPILEEEMPSFPYDPFLFASEGYNHGYVFGMPPGRAYEIHLPDQAPTEAFRFDFFQRGEDRSDPSEGSYFVNENGMPWAINVAYPWRHPLEYMDIIYAYPKFVDFVQSGGANESDWFTEEKALLRNTYSD